MISKIVEDLNVVAVREQFPALKGGMVCLNNAAGSLVHQGAIESVTRSLSSLQLELKFDDDRSLRDTRERDIRYEQLAAFMNASPDEIAFGPSTTALLRNLTQALRPALSGDCEIIVSLMCHEAGVSAWIALAKSLGVTIKWWTPKNWGSRLDHKNAILSVDDLKPLLSPKTRLVTCGHVSNIFGTIHPIREIADLVHTIPGAMLCVDGVAWAPHRPIDVKALDVDFYVFSWYKVFGPHLAQIYARRSVQQQALTSLGHYFFEHQTLDEKIRLGVNCFELEDCCVPITRYLNQVGWEQIINHEEALASTLLKFLMSQPETYIVYGQQTSDPKLRVSLISFTVEGLSSQAVADEIHQTSNYRIAYGDCYSVRPVRTILGLAEDGVIRVSLVHYNTIDEICGFTEVLDRVVHHLRAEQEFLHI